MCSIGPANNPKAHHSLYRQFLRPDLRGASPSRRCEAGREVRRKKEEGRSRTGGATLLPSSFSLLTSAAAGGELVAVDERVVSPQRLARGGVERRALVDDSGPPRRATTRSPSTSPSRAGSARRPPRPRRPLRPTRRAAPESSCPAQCRRRSPRRARRRPRRSRADHRAGGGAGSRPRSPRGPAAALTERVDADTLYPRVHLFSPALEYILPLRILRRRLDEVLNLHLLELARAEK